MSEELRREFKEKRHSEGQGRRLRRRWRAPRQVHQPRQVLVRTREGLRVLRRHLRMGHLRRALRQRRGHRLGHRLPRRARQESMLRRFAFFPMRRTPRTSWSTSTHQDGEPHPACPRNLLKQVTKRAMNGGLQARFSPTEFEFLVFQETPQSLHEKGFRGLDPPEPRHVWILLAP